MKNVMYGMISLLVLLVIVFGSWQFIDYKHQQYQKEHFVWEPVNSTLPAQSDSAKPDLTFSDVKVVAQNSIYATVTGVIENVGNGSAYMGFKIYVTVYGKDNSIVGSGTFYESGSLPPGQSRSFSEMVSVPSNLQAVTATASAN